VTIALGEAKVLTSKCDDEGEAEKEINGWDYCFY
jgi:hypothetical protein